MRNIKIGIFGLLGILVLFILNSVVLASTKSYLITEGLSVNPVTFASVILSKDFEVNYTSGSIVLSQFSDGTGETIVDDGIRMSVTHEDGSISSYSHRYDLACHGLQTLPVTDLTNYFKSGKNQVHIELHDACGFSAGAGSIYLVNLNAPEPPPTKTPVIFIPGIGGSELKVTQDTNWSQPDGHGGTFSHFYKAGDVVWIDPRGPIFADQDFFDVLRMKSDGQTPEAEMEPTRKFISGFYGDIESSFISSGYTSSKDFFVFHYDWRKDIADNISTLDQKINDVKNLSGNSKVDIVTHSMGGIMARSYIANTEKAQNVRKLITLGAPHLGTPEFLKKLMYGGCLTTLNSGPLCIGISPEEVEDVVQNFISGYELVPSQKYFSFYTNDDIYHLYPFNDRRDMDNNSVSGPLDYSRTKTLLTNLNYNTNLFIPAEDFHTLDDNLDKTNGVEVSLIAGSGLPTLGQIIEDNLVDFLGVKLTHKDEKKINGDGTVALFSASLQDQSRDKSLNGSAKVYYTNQLHENLPNNGPAMNLVKNILDEKNEIPEGVSLQPFTFNGQLFSVHSPVNMHIYDQDGNHTGPTTNGDFEANIPGSSYDTLDDAKFIWLPDDGKYQIKFEATGQGSFDFKIRDYKNDINDSTILYKDIPLTTKTTGQAEFDTTQSPPPIVKIDENGDGTNDLQINPTSTLTGESISDQTPPKTIIDIKGDKGNQNWYRGDVVVELLTEDEASGSGILKTQYSLDQGKTILDYTEPFIASSEGILNLRVKSTDKAGNEENLQEAEIKIDKTAPEAKVQFNPTSLNIDILGIDNLTEVKTMDSAGEITFTDQAGNSTKLHYQPKDKKRKEKVELVDISYNNQTQVTFPSNKLVIQYELNKKDSNVLKTLVQKVIIKDQEKIKSEYSMKNNLTKLTVKEPKDKKDKVEEDGLILLLLSTRDGSLTGSF